MRMLKKLFCTIIFSFTFVFNAFADDCIGENNGTPSPTSAVSGLLTWAEMEAAGIITGSGSSWAPTSETMDDYLAGQEWSVTFDNGIVNGYAGCTATGWKTTQSYSAISSANAGCACSLDKNTWWFLSKLDTGTDRYTKTEYCRANCPAACANEVATNATFRDKLFNNACPVIQQTPTTQYTINYDMDGGTGCETVQTYTDTATICEPTRDGYTFDGWMDNNTSDTYNGGDVVSHVNLDLFAFWTIDNYAITYNLNEGTGCSNSTYTIENYITLCTPTRDGYTFDGWYDNVDLTGTAVTEIASGSTGNKEYWAKWNLVCNENQMITTDGCVDAKFTITTIELPANTTIEFNGGAEGTFYIDWGDGSDVMKQNFVGNRHKYANAGVYTIKLGGRATSYRSNYPVIYFNFANKIASVSGSLGQIFPTLNNGENDATLQPNFSQTFYNAINLTSLPSELFDGVHGSLDKMFDRTFYGCTGLQTLPSGLFSGITGGANNMFYQTFYGCSGLKSLPGDLFEDVTNSAINMFYQTFQGCSSLESIPETLFSGIRNGAKNLFGYTFYKCSALKTLPSGLFSNIQSVDESMFRVTFGETGLIEIPSGLFANITESARYLFSGTFFKCENLTTIPENLFGSMTTTHSLFPEMFARCSNLKEVPANLFANLSGVISLDMFWHTFSNTGLESFKYPNGETTPYIPTDFFGDITGYEQPTSSLDPGSVFDDSNLAQSCPANMYIYDLPIDTSPYVSCTPCPNEYPLSDGGKINSNMCYKIVNINCSELNPWQSSNGNPIYANNAATAKQYAQMGATPVLIDANACDMVGANCNPGYKEGIGTTVTTAQLLSSIVNSATEADSDLDSDSVYRYVENTCRMPYNGYIDCDLLTSSFGNETNSYLVNFDYGEIRGTGKCTALTATGDLGASDIVDSADFNEDEYGTNCWCNITKLKTSDDNTQNIQSKWIFNYDFGNNTYSNMDQFDRYITCDLYCANYCAGALHYSTEYRTFMYSNSVLAPQEKQTYICEIDTYTIAFDLNDGEFPVGVVVPENYTTESDTISLPTPTRDGYTFGGWYENAEFTGNAVTQITKGSYGNKTYYAKWTPITYTITYFDWVSANQTEVRMENLMPTTYTIESPTITLPTPTKDGFTFAAWYDKNNIGGDAITTIPTGSTGDKVFYVTWDQITCEPGYYVPAGANGCVECNTDNGNYYCPGGVFNRSTEEVGRNQCPEIVDYGHAVMYGPVDGDGSNCYAKFLYANGNFGWFGLLASGFGRTDIDSMVSEIAQPSYDANSKMNQIADNLLLLCQYNPDTGLYDKCIIDYDMIFGVLTCKNGYYTPNIPQNINASNLYSDSVWKPIAEYENICVPAQRGYYTTLYDAVMTQINNEIQSSDTLDPKGVFSAQRFRSYVGSIIGVNSSNGNLTYEISDTFGDLGNFVAACPTAYPDSEPASWKKAQCFATIHFNTNGGNQIPDQRFYYNNSGKYAGAYEIYSSPLAMVSKNNYDNVTEDCRYYPTNSNNAISTDCSNAIFSDMANREWKIQHVDGFAKGTSHCSVTSGTNGDFGNPSMESGNNCWCKMTAWIDEDNNVIEQNDTQWVLMQSNASDICPNQCAALCAYGAVLAQVNNQSNPIYNGVYTSLSMLSELPTPSKSGAVFAGWYDNPSFAGDVITENSIVSGNRTLYAKWTRNEFVCESGIWLHIGDEDKVCMYETKPDVPTMVVETQNGRYYMMLTEDSNTPIHKNSNKKMRVEMGGRIYNVYDGSVNM